MKDFFSEEVGQAPVDYFSQEVGSQQPSGFSKFMTNLSRPGATNRAMIREGLQSHDLAKVGQAGADAWKNPASQESFSSQFNREAINASPAKDVASNMQVGIGAGAVGMGADLLTDPAQAGTMALTEGIGKLLAPLKIKGLTIGERASKLPIQDFLSTSEGKSSQASDLAIKARNEATRLFPQSQGSLEDVRNTGEAVSKYIRPAKNYEEVANQLELAKGVNAGERQQLLDSGKIANTTGQHDQIVNLMNDVESSPQANTPEGKRKLKLLQDIHTADVEYLNSQSPKTLNDPNFYQQQKEYYQNEANKAGAYRENPSEAIKAEANKAMARGYEQRAQAIDESIRPINQEEKGLIQGHTQAREMAKGEALDMKPHVGKEAVGSISGSPVQTGARFIRKTFLDRLFGSPAKGISRKVSSLMEKAGKSKDIADLIDRIIGQRDMTTLEPQLQLPAPPQTQIGVNKRSYMSNLLPPGQGSGPTINAEGYQAHQPISMGENASYTQTGNLPSVQHQGLQPKPYSVLTPPEYLQEDLGALAKKFGAEEYSGVRSRTSDIPHTNTSKGLSKASLKALARRKKNFGG